MMALFVFIVAAAMVVGGGVGVIVSKHPVHSALSLILTLFGVAVNFVALSANFLAAVQVIVYAGAIVVLFLFVIMLLGVDRVENLSVEPFRVQRPIAAFAGVGTAALIIVAAVVARDAHSATTGSGLELLNAQNLPDHDGNIRALARDLFGNHVVAFELTSALLAIAVIGTVILARKPRKGETEVSDS
jgi:NADH-quinone oxidoreductase subunit J